MTFHDLPPAPYDACERRAGLVSSLSLVRYRGTDYLVPTAYGHREVLIHGYVDAVVLSCGADIIARHVRSYDREDFVFAFFVAGAGSAPFDALPSGSMPSAAKAASVPISVTPWPSS